MYLLNTSGSPIRLKTIQKSMLGTAAEIYNSTADSVYATGITLPVTSEIMKDKYMEAAVSGDEIFTAVCTNRPFKVAGLVRAGLRSENPGTLWINSIVIHPYFRRMGYGSAAVDQLISSIMKDRDISRAYVSVLEENTAGKIFWLYNGFNHIRTVYKRYGSFFGEHKVAVMGRMLSKSIFQLD